MANLINKVKTYLQQSDIFLLLFLLFFTIDMVVVKPLALAAALLYIRKTMTKVDLRAVPKFYLAMPLIGLVNFLFFNSDFSVGHIVSFSIGAAYWLMSFFTFAVMSADVRRSGAGRIQGTLIIFFWINFIVSIYHLLHVMVLAGNINPYGMLHVAYGNSTGDYVRGIFLAPCYINTFVNCAFAFYFLYSRRFILSFLAVVVACLTTSNFASIMLVALLLAAIVFIRGKQARLTVLAELAFIAFFYLFISTNNLNYVMTTLFGKKDSVEMAALKKIQDEMSRRLQTALSVFGNRKLQSNYGKGISMELTYYYLESSPQRLLTGSGIGNFSSQLAVRTSDITAKKKSRLFAMLPAHVASDFQQNHYQVFSVIYGLPEEYHSIRHLPNSFINQIFGEYGVLGFLAFLILYAGYFLRKLRKLRYSIFIGLLLAYFLLFDYMFEYLSIVVFFELFFLLDIKEHDEARELQ